MKRYEYHSTSSWTGDDRSVKRELEELGLEGWELVSVTSAAVRDHITDSMRTRFFFYFKREL